MSNVVPLKQSTRSALIWRRQEIPMKIRPTGSTVLEFWNLLL